MAQGFNETLHLMVDISVQRLYVVDGVVWHFNSFDIFVDRTRIFIQFCIILTGSRIEE